MERAAAATPSMLVCALLAQAKMEPSRKGKLCATRLIAAVAPAVKMQVYSAPSAPKWSSTSLLACWTSSLVLPATGPELRERGAHKGSRKVGGGRAIDGVSAAGGRERRAVSRRVTYLWGLHSVSRSRNSCVAISRLRGASAAPAWST